MPPRNRQVERSNWLAAHRGRGQARGNASAQRARGQPQAARRGRGRGFPQGMPQPQQAAYAVAPLNPIPPAVPVLPSGIISFIRWDGPSGCMTPCHGHEPGAIPLRTNPQAPAQVQPQAQYVAHAAQDAAEVLEGEKNLSYLKMAVDSGCTLHMIKAKDASALSNVRSLSHPIRCKVASADPMSDLICHQIGDFHTTSLANRELKFSPVHIMDKASENLLSVRRIAEDNYPVVILNEDVFVLERHSLRVDALEPILRGYSQRDMWYIDMPIVQHGPHAYHAGNSGLLAGGSSDSPSCSSKDGGSNTSDTVLNSKNIDAFVQFKEFLATHPELTGDELLDLQKEDFKSLLNQLGRTWHFRLGHPGYDTLVRLKQLYPELSKVSFPLSLKECHACRVGKATKNSHKTTRRRAEKPFELLHTDVQGIVLPSAFPNEENYILGITDDFTRYSYVYLMKTKREVHQGLILFLDKIRRLLPHDSSVKYIRMDNGTEYKTSDVVEVLKKWNIKEDPSPPYTSPLNGVAERFNRSIQEKTRCLLSDSGFPKRMWAYAVRYATLQYNLLPKSACMNQIPLQMLLGKPPALKYLKRFGCIAYEKLPLKVGMFSDRAKRKFFVGLKSNCALLLDVSTGKVSRCSNFTSVESQVYGNHYGPFERTPFMDPVVLRRKGKDWFNPCHDDDLEEDMPLEKRLKLKLALDKYPYSNRDLSGYLSNTLLNLRRPITHTLTVPNEMVPYNNLPMLPSTHKTAITYDPNNSRVIPSQSLVPMTKAYYVQVARFWLDQALESHVRPEPVFKNLPPQVPINGILPTYRAYLATISASVDFEDEPKSYAEAMRHPQAQQWQQGLNDEFNAMERLKTWELVDITTVPPHTKFIDSTHVFRKKTQADGTVIYRSRLVARGFKDPNLYDVSETYAPVLELPDLRAILSVVNMKGWFLWQGDIGTAFLNGTLSKPVYMIVPQGYKNFVTLRKTKVCKLTRSIYGLKVSPKCWYERLRAYLLSMGFKPCALKPCIFKWKVESLVLLLLVYVDDLILTGNCPEKKQEVLDKLRTEFEVKDIGEPKEFLGIQITRHLSTRKLFLSQSKFVDKMVKRFGVESTPCVSTPMATTDAARKAKPSQTPAPTNTAYRELIGSLLYLSTGTRPDIAFSVNVLSRRQSEPTGDDWDAAIRVLCYVKGTREKGLLYESRKPNTIEIYCDASLGTNDENARSTSGYLLYVNGDLIMARLQLQCHVALSSAQAEYLAMTFGLRQTTSTRELVRFLFNIKCVPIMYEDNKAAISLAKSLEAKSLKHIVKLCFHYIKFEVQAGNVELKWVPTLDQLADGMTKALTTDKFAKFRDAVVQDPPYAPL